MKGYAAPLYVLPFDHRSSFAKNLLHLSYPLSGKDKTKVTQYKKIVFEAFKLAQQHSNSAQYLAILVDEEFSLPIIKEAKKQGLHFSLPVEKSGQNIFQFEYGAKFKEHLLKYRPTFAKALLRYNPINKKINSLQRKKIKQLADFCEEQGLKLMLELLVPPTTGQLDKCGGRQEVFDKKLRPELAALAVSELYQDDIIPDVWKIEALASQRQWQRLNRIIRHNRQTRNLGIIVLGRGENKDKVENWLRTAARSGLVNGFAVGRTVFMEPLRQYRDRKIKRPEAIKKISRNYLDLINLWESHKQ